VTIALQFRNGETLTGEGVVDAHVRMDARPGVNVRILRFKTAPSAGGARRERRSAPPPAPTPEALEIAAPPPTRGAALEDLVIDDTPETVAPAPPPAQASFGGTLTGEILAAVRGRTRRVQRGAIALAAAALVVAAASLVATRWLRAAPPGAAWSAHMEASARLLAQGRLSGPDGALEHLLAAKRLRPDDAATSGRLAHLADLLETLAARALERGDIPVAAIHLTAAERAAPGRASIRAKLDALAQLRSADPPSPLERAPAGGARTASSR
jgi:hypothetical protein